MTAIALILAAFVYAVTWTLTFTFVLRDLHVGSALIVATLWPLWVAGGLGEMVNDAATAVADSLIDRGSHE